LQDEDSRTSSRTSAKTNGHNQEQKSGRLPSTKERNNGMKNMKTHKRSDLRRTFTLCLLLVAGASGLALANAQHGKLPSVCCAHATKASEQASYWWLRRWIPI
jgi:hypothetical protein